MLQSHSLENIKPPLHYPEFSVMNLHTNFPSACQSETITDVLQLQLKHKHTLHNIRAIKLLVTSLDRMIPNMCFDSFSYPRNIRKNS
jgi:hypothetical protein